MNTREKQASVLEKSRSRIASLTAGLEMYTVRYEVETLELLKFMGTKRERMYLLATGSRTEFFGRIEGHYSCPPSLRITAPGVCTRAHSRQNVALRIRTGTHDVSTRIVAPAETQ